MLFSQINRQNEAFPNLTFTAAGIAAGTNAGTWKTTNAIQTCIAGRAVSKAAADNQSFSTKKPGGKDVELVPSGAHCYILCQMDAAGNLTTVQGEINGGVPEPDYPDKKIVLNATSSATITLSVVGGNILRIDRSTHGLNVGDCIRLDGLTQSGHSGLNGVPLYVVRRIDANSFEVDTPTTFVPKFATGSAYTKDASISMISAARVAIGIIRVAPTSTATFTPGTTSLAASNVNPVYYDIVGHPAFTRV